MFYKGGMEGMNARKAHELKLKIEYFEQRAAWAISAAERKNLQEKINDMREELEALKNA